MQPPWFNGVEENFKFSLWKCEFQEKPSTSFDVELNALSNCAIRKERLCREKQEKMKKLKILWISTRVNQRVEENFKFSRPKCDASNKRTTSFDVELNALSNCAIRKERLCREKQEKMKKLKILSICNHRDSMVSKKTSSFRYENANFKRNRVHHSM